MGGRGSSSATSSRGRTVAAPIAQAPVPQAQTAPPVTPQQQAQVIQQAAQASPTPPAINDTALGSADLKRLVANQDAYMLNDPDADIARGMYISKNGVNGSRYSMSQNLNYKLDNGQALDGNESFIYQHLRGAMQGLGTDTTLYRGAHSDVTRALGLSDWTGMSQSQLQSALVGKQWQAAGFTSTSYDRSKSPFITGALSGGREVLLNIHASGQTRVALGARAQTEVILDVGTHFKVTGARYTGQTATPGGGTKSYRQIVLDVDVW